MTNFTTTTEPVVVSTEREYYESMARDDATWALANSFMILTMQTGFGLLECGSVSTKNISNIMIKNVVDVSLGGLAYWMFGYALTFGKPSNPFCGMGSFFLQVPDEENMGSTYTHYAFQFSFATTATTIVSGAVAERMRLDSYVIFSFFNTLVYVIPASWAWNDVGFLKTRGFFDFAGAAAVHFNGGVSAFVAALMIGARIDRWKHPENYEMSSPVTVLTGMFMLCWAWLAFNCGSTFGVSGKLWKISAKVAVTTLNGSIGGGIAGLLITFVVKKGKYDVSWIVNSVLGGLVGITAVCAVSTPLDCLIIGFIGGALAIAACPLVMKLGIDDPVGAVPVHLCAGLWSTLCVGLFGKNDSLNQLSGHNGLFYGGGFYLLGIQALGCVCIGAWSALTTYITLKLIDITMGIRVTMEEEMLGADAVEHDIRSENLAVKLQMAIRHDQDKEKLKEVFEQIILSVFNAPKDATSHAHHLFPQRQRPGTASQNVTNLSADFLVSAYTRLEESGQIPPQNRINTAGSIRMALSQPPEGKSVALVNPLCDQLSVGQTDAEESPRRRAKSVSSPSSRQEGFAPNIPPPPPLSKRKSVAFRTAQVTPLAPVDFVTPNRVERGRTAVQPQSPRHNWFQQESPQYLLSKTPSTDESTPTPKDKK